MSTIAIPRDRSGLWSLVISVVIHVVVLLPFVSELVPTDIFQLEERAVVVPPLEFDLVSPPENPTPSTNISKYLSTVSSKASDLVDTEKESDLPHSDGEIPFPDTPSREGAEGGGEREAPPLPEEPHTRAPVHSDDHRPACLDLGLKHDDAQGYPLRASP